MSRMKDLYFQAIEAGEDPDDYLDRYLDHADRDKEFEDTEAEYAPGFVEAGRKPVSNKPIHASEVVLCNV